MEEEVLGGKMDVVRTSHERIGWRGHGLMAEHERLIISDDVAEVADMMEMF